ncbi:hypothetical protein HFD88_008125 [Aspergillus terreus]|nr:hypothetical protein HFD88_008125 [Aspergillus terreus]
MIFPRIWSLAVELALRPFPKATSCEPGHNYCGFNLLQLGPYAADINATLAAQNLPLNRWHMHETLFRCEEGRNGKGAVLFAESCEIECRDGGAGYSDWCLNYTRVIAEELQLGFSDRGVLDV